MYNLMNGGQFWMAIFFCTFLIIFGSFFLLNLVLAVIMQAFVNVQGKEAMEEAQDESISPNPQDEMSPEPTAKILDKDKLVHA